MNTSDELIETLVRDLSPLSPHALRKRIVWITALGVAGAVVALAASFLIRTGAHHVTPAAFLVKFLFAASVMVTMVIALAKVARPGGDVRRELLRLATAFGVIVLLAIAQLVVSPIDAYSGLIFGYSALICPFLIIGFGVPAFVLNFWFLRHAAPTRPKLAGFIAGACAGAIGAWVYSWACIENGFAFIAIWYSFGITVSGFAGAIYGSVSLRW